VTVEEPKLNANSGRLFRGPIYCMSPSA